jgi:riboflavin kinase/FMN adenylyltransferase
MHAYEELSRVRPGGPTVMTIGVFDGVHLGHQHLLRQVREEARCQGCLSGALTFRNDPVTVLRPEVKVSYLTTSEERLRLLQAQGLDLVVSLTFDLELSQVRARQFIALLKETLLLQGLVVGPDFALGHQREGTPSFLEALGKEMGFSVVQVPPLEVDGVAVSSSLIRHALAEGDMARAHLLLGRPYALEGNVAKGDGRGRRLGFPTANLQLDPSLTLPADGIYAAWAHLAGRRWMTAASIGLRPTFGPGERTVEAYLLDFHQDLYGQPLRLEFVRRLRPELRFESVDALVAQMHKDVAEVRDVLGRVRDLT